MSERRQYVYDTLTKHDPVTEAGRSFDLLWPGGLSVIDRLAWRERILAIEAEAADRARAEVLAEVEGLRALSEAATPDQPDHFERQDRAYWDGTRADSPYRVAQPVPALDAMRMGRALHRVFNHGCHGGGQDDADGDLGHAVIAEYALLSQPEVK